MIRSAFTAIIALALAAPAAAAADEPPAAIKALAACRAITDNAQRLACYDREAGALVQSVESKETVVLDKQAVRNTKRSLFGFSLPGCRSSATTRTRSRTSSPRSRSRSRRSARSAMAASALRWATARPGKRRKA